MINKLERELNALEILNLFGSAYILESFFFYCGQDVMVLFVELKY